MALVQVFQTSSRAVLRQLKAHQRPVHVARFSPDKLHVVSGSDDATVRVVTILAAFALPGGAWHS